jgi:hypothetical protein
MKRRKKVQFGKGKEKEKSPYKRERGVHVVSP